MGPSRKEPITERFRPNPPLHPPRPARRSGRLTQISVSEIRMGRDDPAFRRGTARLARAPGMFKDSARVRCGRTTSSRGGIFRVLAREMPPRRELVFPQTTRRAKSDLPAHGRDAPCHEMKGTCLHEPPLTE